MLLQSQFLVASLLLPVLSTLFSDWRHTVSSTFFNTQAASVSTEELTLPRHARCAISRFGCNGHSLLLDSYFSKNGRIKNPLYSASGHPTQDTSRLILHCLVAGSVLRALCGDSLSLRSLVQAQAGCPASGAPSSSALHPSLERSRVTTTTRNITPCEKMLYYTLICWKKLLKNETEFFCLFK